MRNIVTSLLVFFSVGLVSGCGEGDKFSDAGYLIVHAGKRNISASRILVQFENVSESDDVEAIVEYRTKHSKQTDPISKFFHFKVNGITRNKNNDDNEVFFITTGKKVRNESVKSHMTKSLDSYDQDDPPSGSVRFRVASNKDLKIDNREIRELSEHYNVNPQDILVGFGMITFSVHGGSYETRASACTVGGERPNGCYMIPIKGNCEWIESKYKNRRGWSCVNE